MPLLEVTDLDKTFTVDNRSVTAIDRLSLAIDEHEFVSIVGPSGCGKSTFLHILGGFEPATAGDLRLNDGDELVLVDGERQAVDRRNAAIIDRERLVEIGHLQQRHRHGPELSSG